MFESGFKKGNKVQVTENVRELAPSHKKFAGEIVTIQSSGPMCSIKEFPDSSKDIPGRLLTPVNSKGNSTELSDKVKRMM